MSATQEAHARTRVFARVMGPYLVIVPTIIALRAPDMGAFASEFFKSDLTVWFTGAGLLFAGLMIIAFHQYWSTLAAVLISLFGWILVLRGVVLMAAPDLYERAGIYLGGAVPLVRLIFVAIAAMGLYLTYVGWLTRPVMLTAENNNNP
jgi:hypothetical protein